MILFLFIIYKQNGWALNIIGYILRVELWCLVGVAVSSAVCTITMYIIHSSADDKSIRHRRMYKFIKNC